MPKEKTYTVCVLTQDHGFSPREHRTRAAGLTLLEAQLAAEDYKRNGYSYDNAGQGAPHCIEWKQVIGTTIREDRE